MYVYLVLYCSGCSEIEKLDYARHVQATRYFGVFSFGFAGEGYFEFVPMGFVGSLWDGCREYIKIVGETSIFFLVRCFLVMVILEILEVIYIIG